MSDSFDKIVPGINPAADIDTEWFAVPTDHQYTGTIRAAHVGSSGTGTTRFSIGVVVSSGISPTKADWQPFNAKLEEGEMIDITYELGEGKAVVVKPNSANISFNLSGLDIDKT